MNYILNLLKPHRKRIVLASAALLMLMLADLGTPIIIALLIDDVIGQSQHALLVPLMIFFLILPLYASVMRFISNYIIAIISQRIILDLRLDLYRHIQRLNCNYLHSTTTGRIMERMRGDVIKLQNVLTSQTLQLGVQVVTGLIMVVTMLAISVKMTLIVLTAVGLYVVNYKYFVPRIRRLQRRYQCKMDNLSAIAQEKLSGIVVVKSFGNERFESREFTKKNFAAERVLHRIMILNNRYGSFIVLLASGTYPILLIFGTYLAIDGQMTFGAVTAACAFAVRLLTPAAMLAEFSNQIQQGKVSLARIFELLQADEDLFNPAGYKPHAKLIGEVEFRDVSFHYRPQKPVLRNINLKIQPGWTVALVGQTGCGKSTIINLLYRFYDVCGGSLLVDGKDIREYDTQAYRRNLAIVPQEPIILDETIANNIAYGRPDASREEIRRAAQMAELEEVITRYPQGLDTLLGEKGIRLSVGEKQRICIARAILADPAILILDEATSSLDTKSETMIQSAMKKVMAGRTNFVVAHRLSTIVDADLIVVLEDGQITEMGNHRQLLNRPDGKYHKLYMTQIAASPYVAV